MSATRTSDTIHDNPWGIDFNQASSVTEGPPVTWMRGHGVVPLRWIGGAYGLYARKGKVNYFCNAVAVAMAGQADQWRGLYADNLQIGFGSWLTRGGAAYADLDAFGGPMDAVTTYAGPGPGSRKGRMRLHWGPLNSSDNRLLQAAERRLAGAATADDYAIPRGVVVLECRALGLRFNSATSLPNYQLMLSAGPQLSPAWLDAGLDATLYPNGVNPVSALVDFLCDARNGWGRPAAQFDLARVVDAATAKAGDANAISPVFTTRKRAAAWATELLETFDGFARRTRVWSIGFVPRGGTDYGEPGDGTHTRLTLHELSRPPMLRTRDPEDAVALAVGTLRPKDTLKDVSFSARSPLKVARGLDRKPKTFTFDHFISVEQGKRWLADWMRDAAEDGFSGELHVRAEHARNPDGTRLRRGDVLWLEEPDLERAMLLRVDRRREAYASGEVVLECTSERGSFPLPADPTIEDLPDLTLPEVTALVYQRAVEMPWAAWRDQPTSVVLLAARPDSTLFGAHLWFSDDGATFGNEPLGTLDSWATFGTTDSTLLVAGATATATFQGEDLDWLESQSAAEQAADTLIAVIGPAAGTAWAKHQMEVCSIGSVTPSGGGVFVLSLARGRLGSRALDHPTGSHIYVLRRDTLARLQHASLVPGATCYLKIQPRNYAQSMDLAAASLLTLTLAAFDLYDLPQITWTQPGIDPVALLGETVEVEIGVTDGMANLTEVWALATYHGDNQANPAQETLSLGSVLDLGWVDAHTLLAKFTGHRTGWWQLRAYARDERPWDLGGATLERWIEVEPLPEIIIEDLPVYAWDPVELDFVLVSGAIDMDWATNTLSFEITVPSGLPEGTQLSVSQSFLPPGAVAANGVEIGLLSLPLVDKIRLTLDKPGVWSFQFGLALGPHRGYYVSGWAPSVTYAVPAITGLIASGSDPITFSWDAAPMATAIEYDVRNVSDPSPSIGSVLLPGDATSKVFTTGTHAVTYRARVRLIDRFGYAGPWAEVDKTWVDGS